MQDSPRKTYRRTLGASVPNNSDKNNGSNHSKNKKHNDDNTLQMLELRSIGAELESRQEQLERELDALKADARAQEASWAAPDRRKARRHALTSRYETCGRRDSVVLKSKDEWSSLARVCLFERGACVRDWSLVLDGGRWLSQQTSVRSTIG